MPHHALCNYPKVGDYLCTCGTHRFDDLKHENAMLRKLLGDIEWNAETRIDYDDTARCCPECNGISPTDYHAVDGRTDGQPVGHLGNCRLAAALGSPPVGGSDG